MKASISIQRFHFWRKNIDILKGNINFDKNKNDLHWVFDPTWAFSTQYEDIILDMHFMLFISKYWRFSFTNEIFE